MSVVEQLISPTNQLISVGMLARLKQAIGEDLRAASSRDNTPLHRAADAHLQIFTLALRAAFNVARKALKGSLRAAGDVEGHEFHGNQWTTGGGEGDYDHAKSSVSDPEIAANAYTVPGDASKKPWELSRKEYEELPTVWRGGKTSSEYVFVSNSEALAKIHGGGKAREFKLAPGSKIYADPEVVGSSASGSLSGWDTLHDEGAGSAIVRSDSLLTPKYDHWRHAEHVAPKRLRSASHSPNISACISTLHAALLKVLPPVLLKAMAAGGNVALGGLKLRAAGDLPGHEFHGNQWTSGGAQDRLSALPKGANPIARDPEDIQEHWSEFDTGTRIPANAPVRDVPIHLIDTDEHQIMASKIAWNIEHSYAPGRAVSGGGRYYLLDGNHRVIAAYLKGEKTVKLRVAPAKRMEGLASLRTLKPQVKGQPHDVKPPFGLAFNVSDPRAAKWAREHVSKIADDISQTSKDRINEAIVRALEGEGIAAAYDEILDAVGNEERADMIARTETMWAANEGQSQGWEQAVEDGLLPPDSRVEWIATSGCCDICDELDGQTRSIDGEYESEEGADGPPQHPNCRCTEGIA